MAIDRPPTLAVDFDGTIVTLAWPAIGELQPNAVSILRYYHERGCRILVHTCRIAQVDPDNVTPRAQWEVDLDIQLLREFLDANGLDFCDIHVDPWKPSADAYIDDKGVRFSEAAGWSGLALHLRYIMEPVINEWEVKTAATGSE